MGGVDAPCAHSWSHCRAHSERSIIAPIDQHGLSAEKANAGIGLKATESQLEKAWCDPVIRRCKIDVFAARRLQAALERWNHPYVARIAEDPDRRGLCGEPN